MNTNVEVIVYKKFLKNEIHENGPSIRIISLPQINHKKKPEEEIERSCQHNSLTESQRLVRLSDFLYHQSQV